MWEGSDFDTGLQVSELQWASDCPTFMWLLLDKLDILNLDQPLS